MKATASCAPRAPLDSAPSGHLPPAVCVCVCVCVCARARVHIMCMYACRSQDAFRSVMSHARARQQHHSTSCAWERASRLASRRRAGAQSAGRRHAGTLRMSGTNRMVTPSPTHAVKAQHANVFPSPKIRAEGANADAPRIAPIFPAAAATPLRLARTSTGKDSWGSM